MVSKGELLQLAHTRLEQAAKLLEAAGEELLGLREGVGLVVHAAFVAALAGILFRGLLSPDVRAYLSEA